ncbi:MAG: Deoxyribodipyrimidine photo-lyase [Actinomycetia bacterium]|nr:Deoxyribodipyrimidine photo-lyase [Actinomycetes bacterium]
MFVAGDVSRYAARREQRLARECARHRKALEVTASHAVVPSGDLRTVSGGPYRIFTPYWRAWSAAAWRQPCPPPPAISVPAGIEPGGLPAQDKGCSERLAPGGERAGLDRARAWLDGPLQGYGDQRDDLARDETSRLSAYLRFGCVSPVELARAVLSRPGGTEFCRQLAWRDFFHQVTAAFPDIATADYRPGPRGPRNWMQDADALDAWRAGRTGIPVVDAGLRQLAAEGFMHNRARMITASFLTRTLGIDWRCGYRHFGELLADGDVACNPGNWQWVAGTGNNPRPGRVLNPLRQAASSIATASTCAATSRNWRASARRTSTRPGSCPARSAGNCGIRARWPSSGRTGLRVRYQASQVRHGDITAALISAHILA